MSDETARLMNRFVRPIYDAIDSRQYKVAIKHCMHKKVAHLAIVQVLKAHCLERTGKVDEALEICRMVQRQKPMDDTLLNTMNLVFKLSGCEHEMLPSYEYACAHTDPPNEDLYTSLFFAYARRGEFLKQQQTALKMFKAFGGVKYMSWASLSMMLQVQHGGAPAKMLALAERMQLKTLRDLKSEDGEALQLLVLIMQLQEKHEDALNAFDELVKPLDSAKDSDKKKKSGATGAQLPKGRSAEGEGAYEEDIELGPMLEIDQLTLEASLTKNVADWVRTTAVYQTLLEKHNGDDWTFLKEYIAARFASLKDAGDLAKLETDVTTFLAELQARPGNELLRGPRLAVVHLLSEVLAKQLAENAPKETLDEVEMRLEAQILEYMERFHTKTCCFTDLQQYFALFLKDSGKVSDAARTHLLDQVSTLASDSVSTAASSKEEGDRKDALSRLHRRLLTLKILRFLGFYNTFTVQELEQVVQDLVDEYNATNWLNVGSTGGQREVQNTDTLLLLAAHFLLDVYQRSVTPGRRDVLFRAAGLLEYGLTKSTYNFQMKLLLSRVYGYLGAGDAMLQRHKELDVKHVQLDSLSFLVLDKMLRLCHFPEARRLSDSIQRLHRSTANDTPEYIARSYKTGVYSKVVDMTRFLYQKMRNSHTLAISSSEALVFGLFDAIAHGPAKLNEHLSSNAFEKELAGLETLLQVTPDAAHLSQNQHREVIVQWTPHAVVATGDTFAHDNAPLVECDRSANFESSVAWLKLRVVVAKLLRAVASNESDGAALVALTDEYVAHLTTLQVVSETPSSDLQQQVWKWSVDAVRAAVQLIGNVNDDASMSATSASWTELQSSFVSITEQLPEALVFHGAASSSSSSELSPYGVATMSLLLGECGLWTLCLLSSALRVASKKRSSRKDDSSASVAALRALLKQMQESLTTLEAHVTAIKLADPDAVALVVDVETIAIAERKARENVRRSYETLQSRLAQLLHDRVAAVRAILQK